VQIRYRGPDGRFMSGAQASQMRGLKHAGEQIRTERYSVDGHRLIARKAGYQSPESMAAIWKRPPSAPPPAEPSPPSAPPVDVPAGPAFRDLDAEFEAAAGELAGTLEEAEDLEESLPELVSMFDEMDGAFRALPDPSEEQAALYQEVKSDFETVQARAEAMEEGYDLDELFGYEILPGEDEYIDDIDIADLTEDLTYEEGK